MIEIKDIAEYEDTDSVLAKYTISDLHHRINKAIEYLELFDDNSSLIDHSIIKGALNILKGSEQE